MLQKYPKLAEKENCAYPERENCNFDDDGLERCPYMKYDNSKSIFSPDRWFCKFKREKFCLNKES